MWNGSFLTDMSSKEDWNSATDFITKVFQYYIDEHKIKSLTDFVSSFPDGCLNNDKSHSGVGASNFILRHTSQGTNRCCNARYKIIIGSDEYYVNTNTGEADIYNLENTKSLNGYIFNRYFGNDTTNYAKKYTGLGSENAASNKKKTEKIFEETISYNIPRCIPDYDQDDCSDEWRFNSIMHYDVNIKESEKIPGLRSFLMAQYDHIVSSRGRFLLNDDIAIVDRCNCFPMIPVILKKELPVKVCKEDDAYILKKIKDLISNNQKDPKKLKEEIEEIIKSQKWYERILGEYYHSGSPYSCEFRLQNGIPYIVIYYRNTDCGDTCLYMAEMSNCLAHEYFHFLHDWYIGKEFNIKSKYRDNVIEALADFFAASYSLSQTSCCGHLYAEKRYNSWISRLGSNWPYAYAAYMYRFKDGSIYNFKETQDPRVRGKFNDILMESKTDIKKAFAQLINK